MTVSQGQPAQQFSQNSLAYTQANAAYINQVASALGVPAAAMAGAIEREMTRTTQAPATQQLVHEVALAYVNGAALFDSQKALQKYYDGA